MAACVIYTLSSLALRTGRLRFLNKIYDFVSSDHRTVFHSASIHLNYILLVVFMVCFIHFLTKQTNTEQIQFALF